MIMLLVATAATAAAVGPQQHQQPQPRDPLQRAGGVGGLVWPLPRLVQPDPSATDRLRISPTVAISTSLPPAALLARGIARYQALLRSQAAAASTRSQAAAGGGTVLAVNLAVPPQGQLASFPSLHTDYSYTLNITLPAAVTVRAATSFGALYALETLAQLSRDGTVPALRIEDSPSYP